MAKLHEKNIIINSLYSIIASLIPAFVLQFLILPRVSIRVSSALYGQIIATISLLNLTSGALGNVLDNAKLISSSKYESINKKGDYNLILLYFISINIVILGITLPYYGNEFMSLGYLLVLLTGPIYLIKEYAAVEYKILLNYKRILINRVIMSIGYLVGFLIFTKSGYWQFVYLFGLSTSFIFVIKTTLTMSEPYRKTDEFKTETKRSFSLLFSGLIISSVTYLDKLLLFPILGGSLTSIYYVASLLGKMISMVITPVNGVVLSYISKLRSFKKKDFYLMLLFSSSVGFIGYMFIMIIAESLLEIIYPDLISSSVEYIKITTLTSLVVVISNMLNTVILKFIVTRVQLIINSVYLITYIVLTMLLVQTNGLYGFCLGALLAALIRLIMIIVIFNYSNPNKIEAN